jgi:hypothetical protein
MQYSKGWDLFQPNCGEQDKMFCRVCNQEMAVIRNVVEPRSFAEAIGNLKSEHDTFICKNSYKDWHQKALDILQEAEKTSSEKLKEMLKNQAKEIIENRNQSKNELA